jgi:hypothetical protein
MALLEDCESIQLSIMHVVDGLLKGTLDATRARLIIQALRIAARNAKNVRFDDVHYRASEQPMVREVPDYAQQYLIEHPEFGPPISQCDEASPIPCGAGAPAREEGPIPCSADTPVREAAENAVVQIQAQAAPQDEQKNASQETATAEPAAEPAAQRRQTTAHGASRSTKPENDPRERKKPPARDAGAAGTERTQASASRHRRRPARRLARSTHRLRIRWNRRLEQRCPILTKKCRRLEGPGRQAGFEDLSSKH